MFRICLVSHQIWQIRKIRIFPEFGTASVRTIDSPKPPPQLSENPDFPDPDIGFPDISGFLFLDQTLLCAAAANLVQKS